MNPRAFKQLANAFNEGIILIAINGDIIQFNDVARQLLPDLADEGIAVKNINMLSAILDNSLTNALIKLIRSNQLSPLPAKLFNPLLKNFHFEGMRFQCDDAEGQFFLLKIWNQSVKVDQFKQLNNVVTNWQKSFKKQKVALDKTRQNEKQLKDAFGSDSEGMFLLDMLTMTVELDKLWSQRLALEESKNGCDFEMWLSRVHDQDREYVRTHIHKHIAGLTENFQLEYRMVDINGKTIWLYLRGRAVEFDQDSKPVRLAGLQSEITQTKKLQQQFYETDTSLQSLLTSMADGVFIAQNEQFVFANQAILTLLGYSHEVFIFKPFSEVIDPDYLRVWTNRFRARVAGAKDVPSRYETRLLTKHGISVWIELIAISMSFQSKPAVMGIVRDITQQKYQENLIWQQANFDSLTGLENRTLFESNLQQQVFSADRSRSRFALVFIDLDNFKDINDTEGHDHGDALLIKIAKRLKTAIGAGDNLSRFGGDEFNILIQNASSPAMVEAQMHKIMAIFDTPFQIGLKRHNVTASAGISLYPDDGSSASLLMRNADQAMFHAKKQGGHQFAYFSSSMQVAAIRKVEILRDLQVALDQGHLFLMYQPIVDLRSGQITKAEALVRWCHETRGSISPAEFIPIAEDSGLILQLGEWVFETAIQKAKQVDEALGRTVQISINQSARQFQDFGGRYRSFVEMIIQHAVSGEMICLEITEHTLFNTQDQSLKIIEQLRQIGVEVALDDFGTGYSSLSYLKKLDIDILKIDRTFISQLQAESDDQVLCEAIILMAHKLGLKVVAEGIETPEQLAILTAIGCDYGQGYFLSRPVYEQNLVSFIEQFDYAVLNQ